MNGNKMPIALVDCDGVLADFASPVIAHCNALTGRRFEFADLTDFEIEKLYPELTFDQVFGPCSKEGFCLGLSAFPGAREGLDSLRRVAKVVALTAPWWPSKHWHAERTVWLIEEMGFASGDIIFASKKQLVRGDLIIDDRYSHVKPWCKANPDKRGFLWSRPYNRDPGSDLVTLTNSWDEVARHAQLIGAGEL